MKCAIVAVDRDPPPYYYRQTMVNSADRLPDSATSPAVAPQQARLTTAPRVHSGDLKHRCDQFIDQQITGSPQEARQEFLRRMFARSIDSDFVTRSRRVEPKIAAAPGDLAFFQQSFIDVAVVCGSDADRVAFVYLYKSQIRQGMISMNEPTVHQRNGLVLNSFVRQRRRSDAVDAGYLASDLLEGFFSPVF